MKSLLLVFVLAASAFAEELKFPGTPPTEPQDAAKTMHVLDGFQMQLIAAEPLVTDPVATTYDEDGRAYVCEMNDYPYTDKEHHKHAQENPTDQAIGRVRLLVDADGDGVFDKATIFAEGLSWPTGCACWKGGIFVFATPDVWYLKDTDGDGVADVRVKVFTGFKKLNVQAVMNNPIWGLDHRIYVAGGSNGGEIQRVPGSEGVMPVPKDFKTLTLGRHDFSFDPSTGDVRLESGGARFGNIFDDWGNRFLCNIRNPCQHVVLPYRYLARNPYLTVPSALNDCAEAGDQLPVYRTSPTEPWREFRAKRWVSEGSTLPKSELVGAGVVTSSAGITIYRGDAYPKEYRDFAFVADVAGNLFYRLKLTPDGVTFKATQVDGQKNFCTSDDLWFRPVNFVNAPDGCLHVCDMYREVIEHPWSIPDDIHAALDLLRGRDKGRLYRLAPPNFKPRAAPPLSKASTTELVTLLDHPNAWHRDTAMRLLFERQDQSAVAPLKEMLASPTEITEVGRINALWSIQGIKPRELGKPMTHGEDDKFLLLAAEAENPLAVGSLSFKDLNWSIGGVNNHLAEHGIRLIEAALPLRATSRPAHYQLPEPPLMQMDCLAELYNRGGEVCDSVRVNFERMLGMSAAWELGNDPNGWWRVVIMEQMHDPWMQQAILLASGRYPGMARGILATLYKYRELREQAEPLIEKLLTVDAQSKQDTDKYVALECACLPEPKQTQVAERWLIAVELALQRSGDDAAALLKRNSGNQSSITADEVAGLSKRIANIHARLRQGISDEAWPLERRATAVRSLACESITHSTKLLAALFIPQQPTELQLAALEALGSYREPEVADILLDAWPKLTPPLRDKAIALILARKERIAKLLDAIEAKKILPGQLSVAARATLQRQKEATLAARIAKLFDTTNSNRAQVIARYAEDLGLKERQHPAFGDGKMPSLPVGDAERGAKVYQTVCMACHRHGDQGNDIGPHLGTVKSWTPEQLLTNILDPNREVSPNFALYIVETHDGRTLSGLIANETAGNLTLKLADGSQQGMLRSEIKTMTSPGISLMPEGLESAISPQQMADLISFLRR